MQFASGSYDDDDDAPPPGFGPRRLEQYGGQQCVQPPPANYQADYGRGQYAAPGAVAAANQYHAGSHHPPAMHSHHQQHLQHDYPGRQPVVPPPAAYNSAVGAARQFQRAISGSLAQPNPADLQQPPQQPPQQYQHQQQYPQQQQQQQKQQQGPSPFAAHSSRPHAPGRQHSPGSPGGAAPDYGLYNEDEGDYGSAGRRSSRPQPGSRYGRSNSQGSNLAGTGGSSGRSYGSLNSSSSWQDGAPQRHNSPLLQQRQPRSGSASPAPPAGLHSPGSRPQAAARFTPDRSPTPDYGPYGNPGSDDEYGQISSSSRKRGGRSRRRLAGPDSRQGPGGSPQQPAAGAAVVSHALAGTNAPGQTPGSSRPRRRRRRGGKGGRGGGRAALSVERAAALEAELEVLRAALAETEQREAEAQMKALTLETDNTTLAAQLQGMRAQKQQLEMMLLFGDEAQHMGGSGGGQYDDGGDAEQYEDEDEEYDDDGDEDADSGLAPGAATEDEAAPRAEEAAPAAALPEGDGPAPPDPHPGSDGGAVAAS